MLVPAGKLTVVANVMIKAAPKPDKLFIVSVSVPAPVNVTSNVLVLSTTTPPNCSRPDDKVIALKFTFTFTLSVALQPLSVFPVTVQVVQVFYFKLKLLIIIFVINP